MLSFTVLIMCYFDQKSKYSSKQACISQWQEEVSPSVKKLLQYRVTESVWQMFYLDVPRVIFIFLHGQHSNPRSLDRMPKHLPLRQHDSLPSWSLKTMNTLSYSENMRILLAAAETMELTKVVLDKLKICK